ncbi:Plasmid recombination enzyme [Roseburia intestinalis XB6B4]|uniref:Plasmid recombination enzyme n=2 Tax=Roseburia intestinalis TaxID=166486 RepID=D4L319_9FIRM|nr:Plasmid recombination enzyme [Roseburia intestinalis XB6B4]
MKAEFYKQEAFAASCSKSDTIEIVGGEQYILSAVMHADERNRAMSEALGQDVFHYHLHVVYVPVVEKQILWSKRCKDKSLVGTVKETIMQVSSSKKWLSKPALDEQGAPILQKNGKPVLRKSYSVLQDDFFKTMRNAGYTDTDVERGERGSSEEHLTVTQFKVEREQERLEEITAQMQQKEQQAASLEKKIEKIQKQQIAVQKVEQIEPHAVPFSSKVMLDRSEYENLAAAAKKLYVQERKEFKLQKALDTAMKMISELKAKVAALTSELTEYKSVRGQLNTAELEQQNELLRNKLHRYEMVIERNSLWHLFRPIRKTKDFTRQEEYR